LVAAIAVFASYRHSGGSAGIAIHQLYDLLQFKTLSPLTNDPDEWFNTAEMSGHDLWQSTRDPACFSNDGGKTYYDVSDSTRTTHHTVEKT